MKRLLLCLLICFTTNIFSQDYKFGKVSKEELEEQFYPLDSTAEAAYLYRKKTISYNFDGEEGWTLVTNVHERIKVYNKKGFSYANKKIRLYNTGGHKEKVSKIKGYTYYLDSKGKKQKTKLSKKNIFEEVKNKNNTYKKITMPGIKNGVVIDLTYQITSPFYRNIDEIQIQESIPVKKIDITVKIPEYLVFKKHQKGFHSIKINRVSKNRRINYSYRQRDGSFRSARTTKHNETVDLVEKIILINEKNIPALRKQAFVSDVENYRTKLLFELSLTKFPNETVEYISTTWEDVSKKIFQSTNFGSQLEKASYFKNDLAPILAKTKSNNEKINTIFQFVKSKVKWNGNYGKYSDNGVRKAYKEGSGNVADINLMLTAMLRFGGLNANPVLVSSKNNGIPLFPTREGYNYVVSSVTFPDNSYVLLDASEIYSVPNVLPVRALNWKGRMIYKDGKSEELYLVPKKHSAETNFLNVKITDDLTVEGMLKSTYTNHLAMAYRKKNNILKEEDVISNLEEKYAVEIENFRLSNQLKLGKPIGQLIKFTSEDLLEEINGKLYITPMLFLAKKENPFKAENRNFPIDFVLPWKEKENVTIQIPNGYKVESIPAPLAIGISENLGVFKYQITNVGNKIKVVSIFQINTAVISSAYYLELKDFYKKVVEKQIEKIVLIKE